MTPSKGSQDDKSTKNFLFQVGTGVVVASILALAGIEFSAAQWRGRVDTVLERVTTNASDIHSILQSMESIRSEAATDRASMLNIMNRLTEDRFKSSDWAREKEILELKFQALHKRFDALEKRIGVDK